MYKPLAEKNEKKIKALMEFYATAYHVIGFVVAGLGLILIPFLDFIIRDKPNIPSITIIYLLFLANTVISYFFSYKRSLVIADQKEYLNSINQNMFALFQCIIQITILLLTNNYFLYLILQILSTLLSNIQMSIKVNKLYPYLKKGKKEYLDKLSKKIIFKHIRAMMSHKFGGVVVNGTDNILLSMFIGVYWVGLYSNYLMIINLVNSFVGQLFSSITASIGHLNVIEKKDKSEKIFYKIFFLNFWSYGFCSIALWLLLNPFIELWLGKKFVISEKIVFIIVLNFFISGMRNTVMTYNSTLGLFWNDRFKPWFEAIINLVASFLLLKHLGAIGVFLGTLISTLLTSFWVDAYILYKHAFKKPLSKYFIKYGLYSLATIIAGVVTEKFSLLFGSDTLLGFVSKLIICLIVPNLIFIILFLKTSEFKYFCDMFLVFIKHPKKSNKLEVTNSK